MHLREHLKFHGKIKLKKCSRFIKQLHNGCFHIKKNQVIIFKKNKLYTLQDIKRLDNGFISYTFIVENEIKEVKFESFKQAEDWLETITI